MKKNILIMLLLLAVVSTVKADTWKESGNWGIYDSKPEVKFKPLDIPVYKKYFTEAARYLISVSGANDKTNKFCLIGYKWNSDNRDERVNVIWDGHYLITWETPDNYSDDSTYIKSLSMSRGMINLKENIVPYSEIGVHTALWPEEGVKQITDDCLHNGNLVEIKPFIKDTDN